MKKYIPILILTGIIAISAPFMRTAKADRGQISSGEVVVLSGATTFLDGVPVAYTVQACSSSANAPKFLPGDDLAQSLATLRQQGYTVNNNAWGFLIYTAIR